jgi:hypothetical protein
VPKGAFTTGAYAINLIVYDSQNGQRFSAPGANADSLLPINTLNVKAW